MGAEVSKSEEYCILVGAWPIGNSLSGKSWKFLPSDGLVITKIVIFAGEVIDSIRFSGSSVKFFSGFPCEDSEKYGGPGGSSRHHTITIEDPSKEYLSLIRGTYGWFCGQTVIRSLAFHTNLHQHGPFGSENGTPFSFSMESGCMAGFHGSAGTYLESIGVYVKPKCFLSELTGQVMKSVVPRGPGPWGCSGGKVWDDGVFKNIKEVIVHVGTSSIVNVAAIEFVYQQDDNGKSSWSPLYGGSRGDTIIQTVKLDCEGGEFMVGISGYYGPIEGVEAIRSISFYTNKDQYGPYGKESGSNYTYFTSSASPGKVVGFHGRSDDYLTAIGVHMQYF